MTVPQIRWLPPSWWVVLLPDAPILELIVRGALVYLLLIAVFRLALRRDLGRMGVTDILLLFLLASAVRQALTGHYFSLGDGLISGGVLIALDLALDYLAYRFRAVHRMLRPDPAILVRDGRIDFLNARRAYLTRADIEEALRERGYASLEDVRAAYLEPNGRISVLGKRE